MKNTIYLLLSCLILSSTINAQSKVNTANYDAIMQSNFDADAPGVSVIVAKKGKAIYTGGIGMANMEFDIPTTPDHVFRIGSITKQFTAVGILMFMEEGKLDLQDEVTKFLPDYPTQGKKITIEHLLTHTSGIQSYTNLPEFGTIATKSMSHEEILNTFKDQPMEFEPGAEYKYNNSGYYLLGLIIEKLSGLSYGDFIQQRIYDKAGMTNSYYGAHEPIIKNRASGYSRGGEDYVNAMHVSMDWPYAAGALLSTVGDLLKWNTALHNEMFVKKSTLNKAFVDYKLNNGEPTGYGYGWVLSNLYGSPSYEHSGGIHGFLTYGLYLPKEEVFVAAFTNCDCKGTDFLAVQLAVEALGKSIQKTSNISLKEDEKADYVGVYKIEDKDKRTISIEEGKLMGQRGSNKYELNLLTKDQFQVKGTLTVLEFTRNQEGKVIEMTSHTRDGKHEVAKLTDEEVLVRKAVEVDAGKLEQYVGEYQLAPTFSIDITAKDGQLYLQATGQQKFPAFPESETRFFLKVVDAQIEFFKKDGKVEKMILFQNGMEMPGVKQ